MRTAVLMLLVVLLGAPAQGQPGKKKPKREPTINGKTIAVWANALDKGKKADKFAAVTALMRAGPEAKPAVPALIKALAEDGLVRVFARLALSRVGEAAVADLQKALKSDNLPTRTGAADALGHIGEDARKAAPALAALLGDKEPGAREAAASALGHIGPAARVAAPNLKKALEDKDQAVAIEAAWALWRVSADASGTEVLASACSADNVGRVLRAIQVLGEIGPKAEAAAKALRVALKHKLPAVGRAAAVALYRVTGSDKEALPVLLAGLEKDDSAPRAIAALGHIKGEKAAAQLLLQFGSAKAERRCEAAAALASRPADIKLTSKALTTGLNDPNGGVRWWCAVGLLAGGQRGNEELVLHALRPTIAEMKLALNVTEPDRVGAALASAIKGATARFRADLARGAGLAGADARRAAPELLGLLSGDDKHARRAAADALPYLGLDVLAAVRRVLNSDSASAREGAARALGGFGLPARSALSALSARIKTGEGPERTQCALALWRIDADPDTALLVLNGVLKDVDSADRWEAVEAVGFIAVTAVPPIKGLTEILVKALKDRDARVRATAARWLWKRVKTGKAVLPLLREVATNRDAFTRQTVAETLAEIKDEPGAVPLLAVYLEDRDLMVRVAAERGLANVAKPEVAVKLLTAKGKRAPAAAVRVLALMGPKAKEALSQLGKLALKDEAARAALGRIFPGKSKELAAYLDALKSGKDTKEAEKALKASGGREPAGVVPKGAKDAAK
jgi:HEAT repeat protein